MVNRLTEEEIDDGGHEDDGDDDEQIGRQVLQVQECEVAEHRVADDADEDARPVGHMERGCLPGFRRALCDEEERKVRHDLGQCGHAGGQLAHDGLRQVEHERDHGHNVDRDGPADGDAVLVRAAEDGGEPALFAAAGHGADCR